MGTDPPNKTIALVRETKRSSQSFELSIEEGEVVTVVEKSLSASKRLSMLAAGKWPSNYVYCTNRVQASGYVSASILSIMEGESDRKTLFLDLPKKVAVYINKLMRKNFGVENGNTTSFEDMIGEDPELAAIFAFTLFIMFKGSENFREKAVILNTIDQFARKYSRADSVLANHILDVENFAQDISFGHRNATQWRQLVFPIMRNIYKRFVAKTSTYRIAMEIFLQSFKAEEKLYLQMDNILANNAPANWQEDLGSLLIEFPCFPNFALEYLAIKKKIPGLVRNVDIFKEVYQICLNELPHVERLEFINKLQKELLNEIFASDNTEMQAEKCKVAEKPPPVLPRNSSLMVKTIPDSPKKRDDSGVPDSFDGAETKPPEPVVALCSQPTPNKAHGKMTPRQVKRTDPFSKNRFSHHSNTIFDVMSPVVPRIWLQDIETCRKLGGGAQAEAFRVRIPDNPSYVVLKKFNESQASSINEMLKEFTKLLECGNHPHVVQLYGLVCNDEEKKEPIGIVLEYMDCGSLWNTIHDAESEYGEKEILEWCLQAASALKHLHSKGLIHRDVKPDNLLITEVGRKKILKLADFGMVKREVPSLAKAPKSRFGTPYYTAPEGLGGSTEECTSAVDIYSLGITIWEIAQRKAPYLPENLDFKTENERIPRPRMDNLNYPWLTDLVPKMWAENPADRPDISEVYSYLDNLYSLYK